MEGIVVIIKPTSLAIFGGTHPIGEGACRNNAGYCDWTFEGAPYMGELVEGSTKNKYGGVGRR